MKRQLNYFMIDGGVGGNQDWFTNYMMNKGGCGAATACDSCIYLARERGMTNLYPFDKDRLTGGDYVAFSQIMKPYISPRPGGVAKLSLYMNGMQEYLEAQGTHLPMEGMSGEVPFQTAREAVRAQIDAGLPIPYLLLYHKDRKKFADFLWHWFLLIGYQEKEDDLMVTAATYGEATDFSLREMWDTGHRQKGGIILYHLK